MWKWLLILAILAPVGLLYAQDSATLKPEELTITHDDFKGYDVVLYKGQSWAAKVDRGKLDLFPQRFTDKDRTVTYELFQAYWAEDWAFLTGNLRLLLDGQLMELPSKGTPRHEVVSGQGIVELLSFDVTREQYRQLASARQVRMQLDAGRLGNLEAEFSDDNFRVIRGFVAGYVQ